MGEDPWKAYKLSEEVYETYLSKSRDGVLSKKRNLDVGVEKAAQEARRAELKERTKRIRSNPELFKPFLPVPQADAWLALFKADRPWYPVLVVLRKSRTGKTEWAQTLFRNLWSSKRVL